MSISFHSSDTHLFNFGARFFSDFATDHVVVLIDAGSRGWQPDSPRWSKGEVNRTTMRNFWGHAANRDALDPDLRKLWRQHYGDGSALAVAKARWAKYSMLIDDLVRLQQILASLGDIAEEAQELNRTTAYNVVHSVASQIWHPIATSHRACCRACKECRLPESRTSSWMKSVGA